MSATAPASPPARPGGALFALSLLLQALWALTIATPVDWDPRYYESVARGLVAGEGAVSRAVWNLGYLPETLPFPADIHWMPLPSRALIPGVWLWPEHGAQLMTVLFAALWAPLAARLARPFGAAVALGAGVCAAAGGAYARFLSTPDSIALYGLIGGLALVALAEGRRGWLPLLAALAGLCRGEGAVLGLVLALADREAPPLRRLGVALAGFAAQGMWMARNLAVFGPDALAARRAATSALDYAAFARGELAEPSLGERLTALGAALPGLLVLGGLVGVFILPGPAIWAAWRRRELAWVRAAALYAALVPPALIAGAPAVAGSGSVFRSVAAVFPALCALGACGLDALGALGARRRGYPRGFGLALGVGAFALASAGVGAQNWRLRPSPPDPCPALADLPPGEVVFAADPLLVEARCGRPAVLLPTGLSPERAEALAARYGIRAALPGEPRWDAGGVAALPDEARRILPGWEPDGALLRRR